MSYIINGLCHRRDVDMGRHGFAIELLPSFKDAVSRSELTQGRIDQQIISCGRDWLDCTGHDGFIDPDDTRSPFERHEKPQKPGPNARPLYEPRNIRVQWGEWGPEHISVPGNACGLDIDRSPFGALSGGGVKLYPHNIDSLHQKYLLLIVFTEIAYNVLLFGLVNEEVAHEKGPAKP